MTVDLIEANGRRARDRWVLFALGLFLTVSNAYKPLTVDDSVYYLFALHISEHPLDPYGFRAWGVQDANTILAPPVFLYWWALELRLIGNEPLLWKLGLLPFSLVLVYSLYALGRRFVRGMELLFVSFVILSGAVLPCLNLMLDIPALALSLLAIVLLMRSCDIDSVAMAVAAGVIAGIATQTKYTAFIAPGVMILYGIQTGKWRYGLIASTLAGLLFVSWELLIARLYGESHFWLACTQMNALTAPKYQLIPSLFGYLGSTLAAGLPLALASLGRSPRLIWVISSLVVAVFVLVVIPIRSTFDSWMVHLLPHPRYFGVFFGIVGFALLAALTTISIRLVRHNQIVDGSRAPRWYSSIDGFLVLWLLLEIAGYVALSPYPATRRLLGIVVIGVLLICRLATRTCGNRGMLWGTVAVNSLVGLLLFAVDFNWNYGPEATAREIARECHESGAEKNIWYFGNAAFGFYGDRLGMKRVITPDAAVSSGDWVLVMNGFEPAFSQHPLSSRCTHQGLHEWRSILHVKSQYQAGNCALQAEEKPLVMVNIYRVK
jgi:hypothetical protein